MEEQKPHDPNKVDKEIGLEVGRVAPDLHAYVPRIHQTSQLGGLPGSKRPAPDVSNGPSGGQPDPHH